VPLGCRVLAETLRLVLMRETGMKANRCARTRSFLSWLLSALAPPPTLHKLLVE
jgi:hypothetical protein